MFSDAHTLKPPMIYISNSPRDTQDGPFHLRRRRTPTHHKSILVTGRHIIPPITVVVVIFLGELMRRAHNHYRRDRDINLFARPATFDMTYVRFCGWLVGRG